MWEENVLAVGRIASRAWLGSSIDDGDPAIWISAEGSEWDLIETQDLRKTGWQDVFAVVEFGAAS